MKKINWIPNKKNQCNSVSCITCPPFYWCCKEEELMKGLSIGCETADVVIPAVKREDKKDSAYSRNLNIHIPIANEG